MQNKFISLQRAIKLEESIHFLSNVKREPGEVLLIGESLDDIDHHYSDLIQELAIYNQRREAIINEFKKAKI